VTQQLTIGFDAKRIVGNATGLGNYGRTLVADLSAGFAKPEFGGIEGQPLLRLYAPDCGRDDLRAQVEQLPGVSLAYAPPSPLPWSKLLWRRRGMVPMLVADGVSLYHGLSGELPAGLRQAGIRSVVTIHDLIFLRHPEYYPPIDRWLYAWKFRQTLREADHIIAISECTRRDVIELGRVAQEKVSVVYQSFAPRFTADAAPALLDEVSHHYGLPSRFVLSVGTIEQRKNLLLAVKALAHLPADVELVCVGRHTGYADQLGRYAQAHGLAHRLHLCHNVPDVHLPAFYALAESFVYPSRYEGFGIPVAEAVSCGLPVVACTGSCLEEAGGPDNLYVDPDDDRGLAAAIVQTLRGAPGREQRIARSRQYIDRFKGCDVARQVAEVYHRLLSSRG